MRFVRHFLPHRFFVRRFKEFLKQPQKHLV
jgi:hypothetical protein